MITFKIFLTLVLLFVLWLIVWFLYDGLAFFSKEWKTIPKSDKITIINLSIIYVFLFVVVIGIIVAVWFFM